MTTLHSPPTAVGRAGRPRDPATDRAITGATMRLLQRDGYRGLSMEAVAAEAGVAKTTIYRRYPSKRELVVATLLAETAFPPPPPELPTREALSALIHQGAAMLIGARAIRILATFLAEEEREPELLEVFRARLVEPRREMLLTILRAGIERGEVRADTRFDVVSEMLLGSIFAHFNVLGRLPDEAWMADVVETIWRAIAVR